MIHTLYFEREKKLVETAADIEPSWLSGVAWIGVTGGASTAEETIDEVVTRLREIGASS